MSWHVRAGHAAMGGPRVAAASCRRQPFLARIGFPCFFCGLAVRLPSPSETGHPGQGVVDYVTRVPRECGSRLPDLQLLHLFCRQATRPRVDGRAMDGGTAIRRARLGWATERYEAGLPVTHDDHLGLPPPQPADHERYRKRWRVRKMRYAMRACRYYGTSHPRHRTPCHSPEESSCFFD